MKRQPTLGAIVLGFALLTLGCRFGAVRPQPGSDQDAGMPDAGAPSFDVSDFVAAFETTFETVCDCLDGAFGSRGLCLVTIRAGAEESTGYALPQHPEQEACMARLLEEDPDAKPSVDCVTPAILRFEECARGESECGDIDLCSGQLEATLAECPQLGPEQSAKWTACADWTPEQAWTNYVEALLPELCECNPDPEGCLAAVQAAVTEELTQCTVEQLDLALADEEVGALARQWLTCFGDDVQASLTCLDETLCENVDALSACVGLIAAHGCQTAPPEVAPFIAVCN